MHRAGSTTTTVRPNATTTWETKEKPQLRPNEEVASIRITTPPPTRKTGGFYDQQTFWQQELYRYHPSFWLLVRIGSLLAFPYLTSALGPHVYPHVVALADSLEVEPQKVALPLISALSMVAFFTHNALYGILYHYEFQAFEKYRVDDKPWHWDLEPTQWKQMLRDTLGQILFNFVGLTFPILFLKTLLGLNTPVLRVEADSLPQWTEIFWQLMVCTVLEDFGFHHTHALLHTKPFYWIHKVHHRYHAPISISAAYAHPLEYLSGNIMPSVMGPALLQRRMHLWTFGVWTVFRASAAIENHSGYEFPWSMYQAIPFKAPTEYHDFHHNRNQGTYSGVLRFWDWVYGTNHHYFEWVRAGRPDTLKTQKFKAKQQKQHKKED